MIGILSDAHGNGPAFSLAIDILRKCGADRFVFLGDAVGYIPSGSVVESIQELGNSIECIRGNHEEIMLGGNFDSAREPIYQHEKTLASLTESQLALVDKWPAQLVREFAAGSALFVHGSPLDPTCDYVYPDTDLSMFDVSHDFVFMGHSHYPFVRRQGRTCYVNVGSCGMPRDDGRFGAAATFEPESGKICLIRFDIREATKEAFESPQSIHGSVKAVYERRSDVPFGEMVNWEKT